MKKIVPGSLVICKLHPEWGPGKATCVKHSDRKVFIVWGEFGKMGDRKYEHCSIDDVELPRRERKRIPITKIVHF